MILAPIILFVYKRPEHARRTIEALRNNKLAGHTKLFVFSDGPRGGPDRQPVHQVREYFRTVSGFESVVIIEREENLGLAGSIIAGVTEIVNRFGRAIILEDDMVTSPYFLTYMNKALELYECEEEVISIHGYMFPVRKKLPDTFFLLGTDCWGWSTWKRGWNLFEPDGEKLVTGIRERNLQRRFDMNGTYPYMRMLVDQTQGKNDSWAVRWYASALINNRFTLYPGKSLVSNIGLDATGTHCDTTSIYDSDLAAEPVRVTKIPVVENAEALATIEEFLRSTRPSLGVSFLSRVKKTLGKHF
jgi:hypothetical protein